jgi:hypothetical protein
MESHLPVPKRTVALESDILTQKGLRLPQPSKLASPTKMPLEERSTNVLWNQTTSPPGTPILKRPHILRSPSVVEEPLTTSHLAAPKTPILQIAGGAKRKLQESALKSPEAKRITLADKAGAPKKLIARPQATTRSVSSSTLAVNKRRQATQLSSTVGPGSKPTRTIIAPKSRVVSGGPSRSIGPGNKPTTRATPAPSNNGPATSSETSRPPSRDSALNKSTNVRPKRPAWDTKGRLEDMELAYHELKERLEGTTFEKENVNELLASERARCSSSSIAMG